MGLALRIFLGFVVLVASHAMFLAAHAFGWYPDEQLARLIEASPDALHVEWVRWILTAIVAALLWAIGYYFLFWRTMLSKPLWVDSQAKFRASTSNPPKGELVRKIERDVWLADAIWRAHLGKWGRPDRDLSGPGVGLDAAQMLHDIIVGEVRQFAFEGKLPVWGKRRGSTLWESVPKEFWKDNRVNYLTIIRDDPALILIEGIPRHERNDEWQELMTSWQSVEYLWPKKDADE